MLYYGLGIGIFLYFSVKNGLLVLDFRQSIFLFLTISLVLAQIFLNEKKIQSKTLIFIQIFVLLAYFFPKQFAFLEAINPYNMRRLARRYRKLQSWADEKFQSVMENMNSKNYDDEETTVASTADVDEDEIEEMRKLLEKKENKLKRLKEKKKVKLKIKEDEEEPKRRRRKPKRRISSKMKKVQFEEENQMSQEEISNMIDNIASALGKRDE